MAKNEASRQRWTQEEIDEIIRFAREGMTAREIAVETGIAENSVSAKLYRLRRDGRLPQVGRGRRKSKETEAADEEMAALMARFSAACAVIRKACSQDGSASGKEGK